VSVVEPLSFLPHPTAMSMSARTAARARPAESFQDMATP
jgi:hypothetical protein